MCFSIYSIASAFAFYPQRLQEKSAKRSAFYTFENRRSADPHFTGGPWLVQSASWPVRKMTSPWVVYTVSWQSASCPVTLLPALSP